MNTPKRILFKNESLNFKFNRDGYVLLPCLSAEETAALKNNLQQLQPSDQYKGNQQNLIGAKSFHVTFFDKNPNYRTQVNRLIQESLFHFTQQYLFRYKCAQANVFLKPAGTGLVTPHQNLTIVDETEYTSVSLWMPLQDTTKENGTICLIPGSQHHFIKYRNTSILWPYLHFFSGITGEKYFTPINVKAGEILIIDDRIIHYTPVNTAQHDRWVAHSLWVPQEAQLKFYSPNTNKTISVFDVADTFWQYYLPGQTLNADAAKKSLPYSEKIYTEIELIQLLNKLKNNKQLNYTNSLTL